MKFGKLDDINKVDFRLPADPPENQDFFQQLKTNKDQRELLIGCTGWSMKEWVGKVYPPKAKTKDFLYHYSRQFATIELNTTHYRIPTPGTIQNWYEQSADDFKFCPKIPQSISHQSQLGINTGYIERFCDAIVGLKEKLGVCFLQLPPYFDPKRIPLLEAFLSKWPSTIPLALEFRQHDWFNRSEETINFFQRLAALGIGMVITDVAGRRDVLHMRTTSPWVLLRFVGNGLVPSDYSRIDEWLSRWQSWFENGIQQVYCFTHEPDNILAPDLAAYVYEKSSILQNAQCRGPVFHQDPSDSQMSLF